MVLLEYIDKLILNINKENIPKTIDLILDSGAFNGAYQLGGLLYLKNMENKNLISIKRLSGASIGAFTGLLYILNKLETSIDLSNEVVNEFKKTKDLTGYKKCLNKFLVENMNKDDYRLANNRLYITYFSIKNKKQIVRNKYKNNKDLIEHIIKSAYIPFLFDGNVSYNNSVDGANPYFFKKRKRRILFLKLITLEKSLTVMSVKNQINNYARILEGISDINRFFTVNKRTDMCSYVDNWNIIDFSIMRIREISWIIILILIDIFVYINKQIPKSIYESQYFIMAKGAFINFYNDVFINFLT